MKKNYFVFMAMALINLWFVTQPKAQTSWLVIPSQYWSNGQWQQFAIIQFDDMSQVSYPGQEQCIRARKSLQKSTPSPAYSLCTLKEPSSRIWK